MDQSESSNTESGVLARLSSLYCSPPGTNLRQSHPRRKHALRLSILVDPRSYYNYQLPIANSSCPRPCPREFSSASCGKRHFVSSGRCQDSTRTRSAVTVPRNICVLTGKGLKPSQTSLLYSTAPQLQVLYLTVRPCGSLTCHFAYDHGSVLSRNRNQ